MYLRESLDEVVYKRFIEGFYTCSYYPGEKIDPTKLANEYHISRTPVVQALKRLTNEMILDVQTNGRFFIPVPTEKKLQDICRTRLLFEKEAIHHLVFKKDQDSIASLSEMAKRCYFDLTSENMVDSVKQDLNFHRALVSSAGNACMQELYNIVLNRFIGIKYVLSGQYSSQRRAADRHIKMMDYIKEENETKAAECIESHILDSMELMIEGMHDYQVSK